MAIRIPYGIDPDETWELDFCAEHARALAAIQRAAATSLRRDAATERDPARKEAMEGAAATSEAQALATEADLAAYQPESGPVFKVTAIQGRKRAALAGRRAELEGMEHGEKRAVALLEWSRDVVAQAVRGHRNLRRPSGAEVAYDSTDGKPSERTLESYGQIIVDLAWTVLGQQRLGPDGKNG